MALSTTSDLLTYLYDELGDTSPNASLQAKYLDALDRANKVITGGGGELNVDDKNTVIESPYIFSWAVEENPIIVNTSAPITTGTIAVTKSSASATLSASQATSLAGWHIKIDNTDVVYKISAHTGGTDAITLDGAYIDTTNAAATYTAFKLDYDFSPASGSMLMPVDRIRVSTGNEWVSLVPREEMEDNYPLHKVCKSIPRQAGILKQSSTGLTVRLSHYTDDIERMELYIVKVPATLTTGGVDPSMPSHHRIVIPHLAAFYLLRRYDDDRARDHLETARRLFRSMKNESMQIYGGNDAMYGVVLPWPEAW